MLSAYIFGYVSLIDPIFRNVWIIPFIATSWLGLRELKKDISLGTFKISMDWKLFALVIFGLLLQMPAIFSSGLLRNGSIPFHFTNSADGVMHLSFMEHMEHHFPPVRPEISEGLLKNYHFLSDLAISEISRFFSLPLIHLYFQYMPVIFCVMLTLTFFSAGRWWTGSKLGGYLSALVWFSVADLGYLFSLLLRGTFSLNYTIIDTGPMQFLNSPQVMAKLLFLCIPIFLNIFWKHGSRVAWIGSILIAVTLLGVKIYFGIFALLGIGLVLAVRFFQRQLTSFEVISFFFVFFLALALYLPAREGTTSLSWTPLVLPKIIFSEGQLNWMDWFLREQVYKQANSWSGMVFLNAQILIAGVFAVFGARILGLLFLPISLPVTKRLYWFFYFIPASVLFFILGFGTFQSPGGMNTYNFLIVTMIFSVVGLSALFQSLLRGSKIFGLIFIFFILGLSAPLPFVQWNFFLQKGLVQFDEFDWSLNEVELFSWIRMNSSSDSLVQYLSGNGLDFRNSTGAFVPFFSSRRSFLSGENILRTHEIEVAGQENLLKNIMQKDFLSILAQEGVDFVVYPLFDFHRFPWVKKWKSAVVYENEAGVVLNTGENKCKENSSSQ